MGMLDNVDRASYLARTLQSSTTQTANGNGSGVRLPKHAGGIVFTLDVSAAATDGTDTLDVKVQTRVDRSDSNWVDVVAFTQVDGSATKRHFEKISATEPQAGFENGTALTAGEVRHFIGDEWRVTWTVGDNNSASFTFSVTAQVM